MSISTTFTRFAAAIARAAGKPVTFAICCLLVVLWAVSGPLFGFSDTWQLVINTSTTIVTFLMVFLIQNTQNRDGAALQAKLDELIRTTAEARNFFVGLEHMDEEEVEAVRRQCEADAERAEAREGARRGPPQETLARLSRSIRTR
ncbi:low affinity iron permease family protein [Desertibaculum subflavum]|uniref:low affinity iron permease family protein n=1 Tax=Desertibaculum subflavum TaxID=2268458 RepID=UPI000E66BC75